LALDDPVPASGSSSPGPKRLEAAQRLQTAALILSTAFAGVHAAAGIPALAIVLGAGAALNLALLRVRVLRRAPRLGLRLTAFETVAIAALTGIVTGGIRSPHLGWWVLCLVTASVVCGRVYGSLLWGSALGISLLAVLDLAGLRAPNWLPPEHADWVRAMSVSAQVVAAASFVLLYASALSSERRKTQRATERFEREVRERQQAQARAGQADRMKSAFLATVSHELRTPLHGVLGMTQLLRDSGLSEEQHRFADIAEQSGRALLELLNELLDFTKLEAGALVLEQRSFAPIPVLEDVATLLAAQACQKHLPVYLQVDPACPREVRGDPLRFRQVVQNLLSNAVKFTNEGQIRVEMGPTDEGGLRVSISDTGIGMSEQTRARLFEPFMQAEASISRRFGGTGLGLSIAKRLVEAMDGRIEVSSSPGKGSRFEAFMQLPSVKSAPRAATARRVAALLVEDSELQRSVAPWLEHWGFTLADERTDAVHVAFTDGPENGPDESCIPLLGIGESANQRGVLARPLRLAELRAACRLPPLDEETAVVELPLRWKLSGLVVDDQAVNRMVTRKVLESSLGLSVTAVGSGAEALDVLRDRSFDIVFMDCQMPEMDGFEATRRIRAELHPARQPFIVALTASMEAAEQNRSRSAGMNAHLTKPIDLTALRTLLSDLFEPERNFREATPVSSPRIS